MMARGSGFRVQGSGFRVPRSGFRFLRTRSNLQRELAASES